MDALVQRSIKLVEDKKRPSIPWKFDEPWHQPYYIHNGTRWISQEATSSASAPTSSNTSPITKLALYSWNIDFMLPFPESRMRTALQDLQQRVVDSKDTVVAIYLQECVESDLKTISEQSWVQQNFCMSDLDISNWQSGHYGTITLLSRSTPPSSLFRVHYSATKMERDALIADITLPSPSNLSSGEAPVIVRFCNSHLESMAFTPALRPPQMSLIASYMHDPTVTAAVAAGDFNAIQPFDRTLHSDNNLLDAYLEMGGEEDDHQGHTWGQQASTNLRERFGTSRMDKVYFTPATGGGSLKLLKFECFGRDVVLEDAKEAKEVVQLGFEKAWVTDHLGVEAVFEIVGGTEPSDQKSSRQKQASL